MEGRGGKKYPHHIHDLLIKIQGLADLGVLDELSGCRELKEPIARFPVL